MFPYVFIFLAFLFELTIVCLEWFVYATPTDDKLGFAVVQVTKSFGIEGFSFTSTRSGEFEGCLVANFGQDAEPASELVEGYCGRSHWGPVLATRCQVG